MYHVHVITIFQCIMLVTGISFIIRMSYSFVSRSVIYLLFLNWHNVRYLFWITFNYMSECLNYPNLTKQNSLVEEMEVGVCVQRETLFKWEIIMLWWNTEAWVASSGVFILHKLFAVSVYLKSEEKLHPEGFCWKEYICTRIGDLSSSVWVLNYFGQRYAASWSGYTLH